MNIPKAGSAAKRLTDAIYKRGAKTWSECEDFVSHHTTKAMLDDGQLVRTDHGYDLSPQLRDYYENSQTIVRPAGVIVPSRTPPEFRPLSAHYIPSLQARRHDAPVFAERPRYTSGQSFEPFRGVWK